MVPLIWNLSGVPVEIVHANRHFARRHGSAFDCHFYREKWRWGMVPFSNQGTLLVDALIS
jgi:hypothetical protein